MKLHYNPASPFVRMVLITAYEAGLADQVELVATGAVSPVEVHPDVTADNPLGRIPCLVTDHGHALYDSRVIGEYLAHHAGHSEFLPDDPVRRFRVLTVQTLAQGIAEAALLLRYETVMRPAELQWPAFAERQRARVTAALDHLEQRWAGELSQVTAASIWTAAALSYLDFRYADWPWRDDRPQLAAFYEAFAQRPSMEATKLANPA